jgi:hypothetical protein
LREEIGGGLRAIGDSIVERLNDALRDTSIICRLYHGVTDRARGAAQRLAEMARALDQRLATAAELQQQTDAQTRQELHRRLRVSANCSPGSAGSGARAQSLI